MYKYFLMIFLFASWFTDAKAQADTLTITLANGSVEKFEIARIRMVKFENVVGVNEEPTLVKALKINDNYPNPFSDQTTLDFEIETTGDVEVNIFDNSGKQIRTLKCSNCLAGRNVLIWDGLNESNIKVSAGSYYYEIKYKNVILTKKMILIK